MGRRSRKRGVPERSSISAAGTTRAERDAARARRAEAADRASARRPADSTRRRRGRPSIDDRPPAPWGSFPLVELVVLLAPEEHRWARVRNEDIGERGCTTYRVQPRFGLLGMLMNWWRVRISSGCPLARGRGPVPRPLSAN